MKITNFNDCLRVSKSLNGVVSPWAIAAAHIESIEDEVDLKVSECLRQSKTLDQKKKLYKELSPFRPEIDSGIVFVAIERQVFEELGKATQQSERWKLLKYSMHTQQTLTIFEHIFDRAQSHGERIEVIKKSPHGWDPWFRFVSRTLHAAETQDQRRELLRVRAVGSYGISNKIRAEITKQAECDLGAATSPGKILEVHQQEDIDSSLCREALKRYISKI